MEMAGRTFKNLQSGVPLLFGGKEKMQYELVSRAMAMGGGEWGVTPHQISLILQTCTTLGQTQ